MAQPDPMNLAPDSSQAGLGPRTMVTAASNLRCGRNADAPSRTAQMRRITASGGRASRVLVALALAACCAACGTAETAPNHAPPVELAEQVIERSTLGPDEALPAPSGNAVLTVTGRIAQGPADGALRLDAAGLQRLGLRQVTVYEPFVRQPMDFQGVWLADVLAAAKVSASATSLHLTAIDNYETDLTMADVQAGVFLATRTGTGGPIPVEDGGPTRIVIPGDIPSGTTDAKWIWSLSTIDVR
jgi:hypothetical protein